MNFFSFFSKEREFKMVWEIQKEGNKSFLAGTAHFFPFSFKKSLTRYIADANAVLFEGPLDQSSMDKVIEHGAKGGESRSLEGVMDARTIDEINKLEYAIPPRTHSYFDTDLMVFGQSPDNLYSRIKDKRPWMAFFEIWSYYREKNGWKYTMDRDALNIAKKLGKDIHFLEKIEEQIDALNGVPLERIATFLKKIERWDGYTQRYVKYYLRGDIEGLISFAAEFPTYCESIIDKRDPILYERMKPYFEKGNAMAFVGFSHIKGIKELLIKDGYSVQIIDIQ